MMPLHLGNVKHPGEISFVPNGYWDVYQPHGEKEQRTFRYYSEPRKQVRNIRKMYGFSIRGFFFGVMLFDKPKE